MDMFFLMSLVLDLMLFIRLFGRIYIERKLKYIHYYVINIFFGIIQGTSFVIKRFISPLFATSSTKRGYPALLTDSLRQFCMITPIHDSGVVMYYSKTVKMPDSMFPSEISCSTAESIPVIIYKDMIKFVAIT